MATALETLQTSLKDKRDLLTKKESQLSAEKNDNALIAEAAKKYRIDQGTSACSTKDKNKGYRAWVASTGQIWCDEASSRQYRASSEALVAWDNRKKVLTGEIDNLKKEIDTLEQKIKDYVNSPAGKKELDIIQVKEQSNAQVAVTNAQAQLVNAQTQQSQARIEETKSSTKKTIIIVLVIVLILSLVGGIWWYIKKRKSNKK
jgi:cobalamin biosynthesis Mg chelatase CobN